MARNKLFAAALLCIALPAGAAEEFIPMEGMTLGQIQRAADEIAVLSAQDNVLKMRTQLKEKREQVSGGPKVEIDSSAPPVPPPAPIFTAAPETPIANGIVVNTIQGVGDRLYASINYNGTEMAVKGGDILPSGEVVEEVAPNSIKVTRFTKPKKGQMKRQSKTVFIGNNAVDFSANAMPQLPPLPEQPGMGAPITIRPGR
jgi:type IV pilus biogenesis protein PilP